MKTAEPLETTASPPPHSLVEPDPYHLSAIRIAGTYLVAGILWIALSDFTLALTGGLTSTGFLVSASKGCLFVLLSTALVYWLCQREYRVIKRSSDLLRAVVEGTSDAVFVKDRAGRYLLANAAAARFLGRSVSDVLGRDDRELFDAAGAQRVMEHDRAIMKSKEVVTVEDTLTAHGVTRTFQATKAPYFDAHGQVSGLIGISRNITDRKRIEAALHETDARLREAQRIAKLGSWAWEPPTDHVWWSDAEFELFGVDPQVVRPSFEAFLSLVHPEDRPIAIARVEAMQAGADQFADDLRIVRPDGNCMWIHSQARATRDTAGRLMRVEGTDQDITAQRHAREAVLESERRLQAAVEVAGLGVIVVDYEQQTAELSLRAAQQFGFASGTTVNREELHSRIHPTDYLELQRLIERALDPNGSGCFATEHRVVHPDGSIRWLNVRKQVTFDAGQPKQAVVVTADVSEQRHAVARLREQEMLQREAAELARVGGWGFDPNTLQPDWTPTVAQIFGLPSDVTPPTENALDYFHPDQRPVLDAALKLAMQEGRPYDLELQITAKNGQVRWVRTICRPIVEEGRVIRVRGSLQDITDRKRAESELRASEQQYRLLFDFNPHPMWVYDVESLKFLAVNEAAIASYGYSRQQFLSMSILEIRPTEELPEFETFVSRIEPALCHSKHWRHKRRDGTVIDVEVSSYDLPMTSGRSRLVLALDITARKQAESKLQESERRLKLALEAAGAVAFVWDIPKDAVTRYYSTEPALPVTQDRTGSIDEVRSRVHPDDLPGFDSRLSTSLAQGNAYRNEYRVVRPDGTIAWLEDYGVIDRSVDGQALYLTGLVLNVTSRVAATEALRTSEARYRQLVDMLPTAIFVQADNQIVFGNPAFLQLMGASTAEEMLGRSPMDITHPSYHETLKRRQEELQRTGAVVDGCDMLGLRRDGRAVPVHVIAAPVDGYGRAATVVALTDLTERERSTALLRSVLNSVGDAIITIDASGIITSANRATERLFGFSDIELLGNNVALLMPDPHRQQHDQYIVNYLQSHTPKVIGLGREVEGRRKDGTLFPAELTITEFMRDGHQEFTGVLRDITARRQLEEQFRQAQKMEAVGRLAGGVAHDFNNLLTVINGYSELMLAELSQDDPARSSLTAILDAGGRAARLTEQLLAFSRKSIVEPQLVDLNELVIESSRLLRRIIGEDITLTVNTVPAPTMVVIDPGQLEQVLMNLAVNARDAMPTGGRLTIETSLLEQHSDVDAVHIEALSGWYAMLRITDTGAGMTTEVREKAFEPFYTTKDVGKGTGLGLAVVHGIVEQAGGSVTVDSAVGQGTSFKILLPAMTSATREHQLFEAPVAPRGEETVLVVEDEDAVRTLVKVTLESLGYTVLVAANGNEAQELLTNDPSGVDLLVTDVIMPAISGRDLAMSLREKHPELRVLFMSGYTDDALVRLGMNGQVDQFIQKPFTPLGLARRVRELLDQST